MNPDWDKSYLKHPSTHGSTLAKRYDLSRDEYYCCDRWATCSADAIENGVNYLRGVPDAPVKGPGRETVVESVALMTLQSGGATM